MSFPHFSLAVPSSVAASSSQMLLSSPPVVAARPGAGPSPGVGGGGGGGSGPGTPCCETGRPVLADPSTGQTVCSCQYPGPPPHGPGPGPGSGHPHPAGLLAAYPRLAGLPAEYATAAAAYTALPGLTPEHSALFTTLGHPYEKIENQEALRSLAQSSAYYATYDPALAAYPYGYGSMDPNSAARRKNATRENTTTLKAWLYEHRKNPYPTKGEKIMLAIITKMTLTQVSTWFANARRRLKKENKMTWTPRNGSKDDEDDDDLDDADRDGVVSPVFSGEGSQPHSNGLEMHTDDAERVQQSDSEDEDIIIDDRGYDDVSLPNISIDHSHSPNPHEEEAADKLRRCIQDGVTSCPQESVGSSHDSPRSRSRSVSPGLEITEKSTPLRASTPIQNPHHSISIHSTSNNNNIVSQFKEVDRHSSTDNGNREELARNSSSSDVSESHHNGKPTEQRNDSNSTNGSSSQSPGSSGVKPKPRIWSLADVATSTSPPPGRRSPPLVSHPASAAQSLAQPRPSLPYPPTSAPVTTINGLRPWVNGTFSVGLTHPAGFPHPYILGHPGLSANPEAGPRVHFTPLGHTMDPRAMDPRTLDPRLLATLPGYNLHSLMAHAQHLQEGSKLAPPNGISTSSHFSAEQLSAKYAAEPKVSLPSRREETAFRPVPKRPSPL